MATEKRIVVRRAPGGVLCGHQHRTINDAINCVRVQSRLYPPAKEATLQVPIFTLVTIEVESDE